jgi:Mn2+/Fe2+ NRAMP family transporter
VSPPPGPSPTRWRLLGQVTPEVLTAAADNDPTNIGAAALTGAQTGYQLSWVAVAIAPLLSVVLGIAAQVGAAGQGDLQSLVSRHYGRLVGRLLLVSVVLVNLVTIAADLQAGAAGLGILTGAGSGWFIAPLSLALLGLIVIGRYQYLVAVMRFALVGFLAFGAAAVLAKPDWPQAIRATFVPDLTFSSKSFSGILSLLGTTLTTYVYLWETIARGVENGGDGGDAELNGKERPSAHLGAIVGSVFTAVILWFMLITFAATLGVHHQSVETAQDAARALRPLAGALAGDMLAVGLVASAVVALPVLLTTTGYALGSEFGWEPGLSGRGIRTRAFYGALAAAATVAVVVDLAGVPVLRMLAVANVVSGLAAPVGLILLVRLARDPRVMGDRLVSPRLAAAGWAVALGVGGSGLLYLVAGLAGLAR